MIWQKKVGGCVLYGYPGPPYLVSPGGGGGARVLYGSLPYHPPPGGRGVYVLVYLPVYGPFKKRRFCNCGLNESLTLLYPRVPYDLTTTVLTKLTGAHVRENLKQSMSRCTGHKSQIVRREPETTSTVCGKETTCLDRFKSDRLWRYVNRNLRKTFFSATWYRILNFRQIFSIIL